MAPGRCLGSLLLLLGGNLAALLQTHPDSLNGTVGQSVLLPVSYTFDAAPEFPLPISWSFKNCTDTLISCTVQNCSLGAGGAPSNCSGNCFPNGSSHGRARLFYTNGSLLLRDLQLGDTGVYCVTFGRLKETGNITLTVHEQHSTPGHPGEHGTLDHDHIRYLLIGICALFLLLLLLLFYCLRHRGAAQCQKRRILKQQQVSTVEESHMESTMVRDLTSVYARVGDSFEQPQPTLTPEVTYATITSPAPPRPSTQPRHLLV